MDYTALLDKIAHAEAMTKTAGALETAAGGLSTVSNALRYGRDNLVPQETRRSIEADARDGRLGALGGLVFNRELAQMPAGTQNIPEELKPREGAYNFGETTRSVMTDPAVTVGGREFTVPQIALAAFMLAKGHKAGVALAGMKGLAPAGGRTMRAARWTARHTVGALPMSAAGYAAIEGPNWMLTPKPSTQESTVALEAQTAANAQLAATRSALKKDYDESYSYNPHMASLAGGVLGGLTGYVIPRKNKLLWTIAASLMGATAPYAVKGLLDMRKRGADLTMGQHLRSLASEAPAAIDRNKWELLSGAALGLGTLAAVRGMLVPGNRWWWLGGGAGLAGLGVAAAYKAQQHPEMQLSIRDMAKSKDWMDKREHPQTPKVRTMIRTVGATEDQLSDRDINRMMYDWTMAAGNEKRQEQVIGEYTGGVLEAQGFEPGDPDRAATVKTLNDALGALKDGDPVAAMGVVTDYTRRAQARNAALTWVAPNGAVTQQDKDKFMAMQAQYKGARK